MRVVYKYPLDIASTVTRKMPEGAEVLHVGMQDEGLMLWALAKAPSEHAWANETRTFRVYGTGHPIPDDVLAQYLGSVKDGPFIWHVFEIK